MKLIQHKWFKGWIIWSWETARWYQVDEPHELGR